MQVESASGKGKGKGGHGGRGRAQSAGQAGVGALPGAESSSTSLLEDQTGGPLGGGESSSSVPGTPSRHAAGATFPSAGAGPGSAAPKSGSGGGAGDVPDLEAGEGLGGGAGDAAGALPPFDLEPSF